MRRLVGAALERRAIAAAALIVAQLAASFALTYLLGGASNVPPHWFYVPILFAGLRFGVAGAIPTAAVSAVLAGPFMPADVSAGVAQHTSDWGVRAVFFLAVGVALPAMMRRGTSTVQQDRRDERVEAEVRRALEHGEFVLHYQPIVALDDGRIIGAEALLRWQHPQHGLLSPAAFIDDLERLGSIANWVLGEATVAAARWRAAAGHEEFLMSVNVSAKNIAQPDFVAQVRAALRAARLPPEHLCLEITESAAFEDLARASARLQVLRSIGVQIALDDFGTGHATLSYLQQLPFDVIKIDRSFVQDLGRSSCGSTIVATIQRLATDLDVTCVAEGVETEGQLDHLRELCCTAAQGYLFGRPQPAAQFGELLHSSPTAGSAPDRSA